MTELTADLKFLKFSVNSQKEMLTSTDDRSMEIHSNMSRVREGSVKLEEPIDMIDRPQPQCRERLRSRLKGRRIGGASDDASRTRSSSSTCGHGEQLREDDRHKTGQHASDLNGSGLNDQCRAGTFPGEDCN
jgi:hypothetical protein